MPFDFDLSGDEFAEFQNALDRAFLDYSDLNMLVVHTFGSQESLHNIAAPARKTVVIMELLMWAQAGGKLDRLLEGALKKKPDNPYLKRFGQRYIVTSAQPLPGLQKVVMQGVPFVGDPAAYLDEFGSRMTEAARCVGRFEIPADTGVGTGFLVAPDVALTNWHVAELIGRQAKPPEQCGLRFDYVKDRAGSVAIGEFVGLAAGKWLLDSAPIDKLDYALVRLSQRVGDQRGWLKPQPHTFQRDEPHFILQHPAAEPMILQVGSVTGVDSLLHRITYTTNTIGGSSGSPCFTMAWEPVVLHNWGETANNAGYTLAAIQQNVRQTKPTLAAELGW